ncbi:MAG: ABC transporter permease [Lachnospiraceae bacterium]|nr:ABC transporter permease [Lachnospiraceae bacterium]
MLRLIQTEFLKLRRRKFIWLMLLASLFMPLMSLFYFRNSSISELTPVQFYKWTAFSYTPWIVLPVVLGILCTMLMYDENQYDMLKQLWIIPVDKTGYFFSKFIVVFFYSICFMLITATISLALGILADYIPFDLENTLYLFKKCVEIGVITPFSILPLLTTAAWQKGYILSICITLIYTFLGFILLAINMYLHPLSSMTAIIMRDMPSVVMPQKLTISAAVFCISAWDIGSIFFANIALNIRK